jgi:hypothetical protein
VQLLILGRPLEGGLSQAMEAGPEFFLPHAVGRVLGEVVVGREK